MTLSDEFLLKTQWNRWRMYGWRQPLQLLLVAGPLLIWMGMQAAHWLNTISSNPWLLFGLGLLGFVILNGLSAPFIMRYALPRQTELHLFFTLPLSRKDTLHLLAFYYHKFQLPSLIWAYIFAAGLVNFMGPATLLPILFFIVIDGLIFRITIARTSKQAGGLQLERLFPIHKNPYHKSSFSSRKMVSASPFLNLLKKEWLGSWRNPHYRGLKAVTALFYVFVQILLFTQLTHSRDMWMMLASAALFWLHFTSYFNPKYVLPEPEWLFRTQPVSFVKLWMVKFTAEFVFVFGLLAAQWIFLILSGIDIFTQLNWMGALALFAVAVLSLTLHFQILFFDNPRQAGYAYHLTVLFMVVLSINFRLVGPLVSLIFLIGLTVQTIRAYHS